MSADAVAGQEGVSSQILDHRFSDLEALTSYLDSLNVKYVLVEDAIGKEPPQSKSVNWNPARNMRYLVLLPKHPEKLFRFRVYETDEGGLHLESDFAYKNPYQR
jgi:hypothetical protein